MINKEYLELLKECNLNNNPKQEAKGIHFGFLMTFKDDYPALKDYLLDNDREIFPYEEFQMYQINLCTTNPDTLKPELKVPLFETGVGDDEFSLFLTLLSQYHINGRGHQNQQLEYSIFDSDSRVDKEALMKAKAVKDFNLERCAIVISNYYETTKYATKLATYLGGTTFVQDYKLYVN
jgi:hypothetical protein